MIETLGAMVSWIPVSIPAFLFVLTVIVFVHELGHFLVARYFGVKVDTFSIGFGREIWGRTDSKGTRWKLSWLPLGGYVKFAGDADASSRTDRDAIARMSDDERAGAFQLKPLYQRALVIAAGPGANFVFAIVIFALLFMTLGRQIVPAIVADVRPDSAAAEAGFHPGDAIIEADGIEIETFSDLQRIVATSAGVAIDFVVERDAREIVLQATPRATEITDRFGNVQRIGILGITNRVDADAVRLERYGPVEAVWRAMAETWFIVDRTFSYLGRMITGAEDTSQLSGPIGIAKVSGDVAGISLIALINFMALVSISIGLVNLFPIPVLDGGHLLYYAFEAATGRPLGERAQEMGFRLGLALVLSLMLLATWNDLVRYDLF